MTIVESGIRPDEMRVDGGGMEAFATCFRVN